jgi:uncharacterized membrane protein
MAAASITMMAASIEAAPAAPWLQRAAPAAAAAAAAAHSIGCKATMVLASANITKTAD